MAITPLNAYLAKPAARYLVCLDFEATCEDGSPWPQDMEIIEIGAVVVDLHSRVAIDQLQVFVKPVVRSQLTPFCTRLTGITQRQVDAGLKLAGALDSLMRFIQPYSENWSWCSWGKSDRLLLEQDVIRAGLSEPLGSARTYASLKVAFSKMTPYRKHVGIKKAVELSGLDWIGSHHSGLDDARNVAQVAIYLTSDRAS